MLYPRRPVRRARHGTSRRGRRQVQTGADIGTRANQNLNDLRRLAAIALTTLLLLCQTPAARSQQRQLASADADDDVIKVTTRLVGVTVELADGTRDDSDLRALDINADGVHHRPAFAAVEGGANVGLVVDMSTSMKGRKASRTREAVQEFLKHSDPRNKYALIVFNGAVNFVGEFRGDEGGRRALDEALGETIAEGETILYDACLKARDVVAGMSGEHSKRALVVFTDGHDTRSKTPLAALDRGLNSLGGLVYLVVLGSAVQAEQPYTSNPDTYNESVARELAKAARGEAFPARSAVSLIDASRKVAKRLSRTAHLGFYPTQAAALPGTHTLSVTTPGGRTLRARERYTIDGPGVEQDDEKPPALTPWQQAIRDVEGETNDSLILEVALRRRAPQLSPEARRFYKNELFKHPDLASTPILDSDTDEARRVREIILPVLTQFDRADYDVVILKQDAPFSGIWRECVILLSTGTVKLLTQKQLRAAVSHDLAHECFIDELVEADRQKKPDAAYHVIEHECDLVAALAGRARGENPAEISAAVERIEKHQKDHPDPRLDTSKHPPARERRHCVQVFMARLYERSLNSSGGRAQRR